MTSVFFLFLLHFAAGALVALPFVPEQAGRSFFKFMSAAAALMSTWAVGLLLRRHGLDAGAGAPGGADYPWVAWGGLALVSGSVLYNRAWHFGWRRATGPLLAASLAAGLVASVAAGAAQGGWRVASDLTSILLLGAAGGAMVLGHWYLVVLDLSIVALRRLTVLLGVALLLRVMVVAGSLIGPVHAGADVASLVAHGLWSPDGVFVWMRLLFGLAGPAALMGYVWKTVEIRSTQSATGILYVQLFMVLAGELLAKYLTVVAGMPL